MSNSPRTPIIVTLYPSGRKRMVFAERMLFASENKPAGDAEEQTLELLRPGVGVERITLAKAADTTVYLLSPGGEVKQIKVLETPEQIRDQIIETRRLENTTQ